MLFEKFVLVQRVLCPFHILHKIYICIPFHYSCILVIGWTENKNKYLDPFHLVWFGSVFSIRWAIGQLVMSVFICLFVYYLWNDFLAAFSSFILMPPFISFRVETIECDKCMCKCAMASVGYVIRICYNLSCRIISNFSVPKNGNFLFIRNSNKTRVFRFR